MISIDKQSKIPYYYQLADLLRDFIHNVPAADSPLLMPSEVELSKTHHISRATVRQAFDLLEREGLVYKQKGKGTFAVKTRNRYNLTTLIPTTDDIVRRGWTPSVRVLSVRQFTPPQHVAKALAETGEVFELCRLRLGNGEPISVQWSYLPVRLYPGLLDHDLSGSLTHVLEDRYHLRLWTAHEILRARLVTATEARWLEVPPRSPVIYMERVSYSPDLVPLEFLESVWRSDKYDFEFSLSRA